MSITTQCRETDPGATLVPNSERDWGHPIWVRTEWQGLVLDKGEINGYDDSDFFAVVWDPEAGCTRNVEYASTRGWTYCNSATIDATPEVRAAAEAYLAERRRLAAIEQAKAEARIPKRGRRVRITRGRGPKDWAGAWKGEEAEIFWIGANQHRTYYRNGYNRPDALHNQRVGIAFADGRRAFTSAENVEVITEEG